MSYALSKSPAVMSLCFAVACLLSFVRQVEVRIPDSEDRSLTRTDQQNTRRPIFLLEHQACQIQTGSRHTSTCTQVRQVYHMLASHERSPKPWPNYEPVTLSIGNDCGGIWILAPAVFHDEVFHRKYEYYNCAY